MDERAYWHRQTMMGWIEGHDCLSIVNKSIYCKDCSLTLTAPQKSAVQRHVQSKNHLSKLTSSSPDTFNEDLCEAFLAAKIPLAKVSNPKLKSFLEKYTNRHIIDPSNLRKIYLPKCHSKLMGEIKDNLSNQYLWVSAADMVDTFGRCTVNVVIGALHPTNNSHKPYLIASRIIPEVSAETVANVVRESIENTFQSRDQSQERVLLFVTDAAAYMLQAGTLLKETYPNMLHITCIADALHRLCEYVREKFPNVDALMSSFKNIFRNSPSLVSLYKEKLPPLSLPLAPMLTRWGTWLEASYFYSENFDRLKDFVFLLSDDSPNIKRCKKNFLKETIKTDLKFIERNFKSLSSTISYFQNEHIKLYDALTRLITMINGMKSIPGQFGKHLTKKVETIFNKNPDLKVLHQFCEGITEPSLYNKYNNLIENFNYAPLTSREVEQSFSAVKDLLNSKKANLKEENLQTTIIVNFNSRRMDRFVNDSEFMDVKSDD